MRGLFVFIALEAENKEKRSCLSELEVKMDWSITAQLGKSPRNNQVTLQHCYVTVFMILQNFVLCLFISRTLPPNVQDLLHSLLHPSYNSVSSGDQISVISQPSIARSKARRICERGELLWARVHGRRQLVLFSGSVFCCSVQQVGKMLLSDAMCRRESCVTPWAEVVLW